jgi:hypothetical protein
MSISPSIREVCLIGRAPELPVKRWNPGDRVKRSGRIYQVEGTFQGDFAVYLHLAEPTERPR